MKPRLMGAREIGERLGVCRQRIQQLSERDDFPEPFQALSMGRVWWECDVEVWVTWWRSGGDPATRPDFGEPDDDIYRRLAERVADYLGEQGRAFIEDDQVGTVGGLIRVVLHSAGVDIRSAGP
ncbi:helix-turn-helix transcriptional regulator [Actinoplanes sp. HUAS TT8]|uniref:helix-turn-helix transcriptional regulator n=1 Tax=Actinoplanes sp. HUAS TT8 TaxID=3447453 RepID=UPI003F51B281